MPGTRRYNNTYTVDGQRAVGVRQDTISPSADSTSTVQFNYYKALGPTGPMSYTFSGPRRRVPVTIWGLRERHRGADRLRHAASYMIGATSGEPRDPFVPGWARAGEIHRSGRRTTTG